MRYRSKKRAKIDREVMRDRRAFIAEMYSCAACGDAWRDSYPAVLDCHEIIRGGVRVLMIQDRRAWLCVCRTHNQAMHDLSQWPNELQFALKQLQDPDHYNLKWLNMQRGAGVGITQNEVDEAAKTFRNR